MRGVSSPLKSLTVRPCNGVISSSEHGSSVPQQSETGGGSRRSSSVLHPLQITTLLQSLGRGTVAPYDGTDPQDKGDSTTRPDSQPRHSSLLREIPQEVPRPPNSMNGSGRETILVNGPNDQIKTLKNTLTPSHESPPAIPKQPSNLTSEFHFFGYSLADFWERLDVSHCGQYSVERMLAFDEYCQRSSIARVLATCVVFPLGPLLVIVLTECIPLQPVEKGALANYVFWIRHTMMGIILIVCAMSQAKVWIPELKLSMKKVAVVAIGSASVYTSLNILIATLWVFPIPLLVVAGAPLMFSIWAVASRAALGPHPMEGIKNGEFRGRRFLLLTSVHAALLGIYPAYQAVFLALDGVWQLLVVLTIPALNLALKNLQTALGSHLEDSLPEVIVFTIDVFATIYSVLCMHSANSMKMVVLTVALSMFVVLMTLYGMDRHSQMARACRSFHGSPFQQQRMGPAPLALQCPGDSESFSTLVMVTVKLLQRPDQLDAAELRDIRLLSGMQHQLSGGNVALLESLASRSVYNNDRLTPRTVSIGQMKAQYATAAMEGRALSFSRFVVSSRPRSKLFQRLHAAVTVVPTMNSRFKTSLRSRLGSAFSSPTRSSLRSPAPCEGLAASIKLQPAVRTSNPVISSVVEEPQRQNIKAVKQTLQLLFNNEYIGLIAYTQCFIPVIYLLYMPLLKALPNHSYYPTHYRYFGDPHEFNERMAVIGALAAMQFGTLVALQVFVTKRFGVSTIYQVAFVLETQFLFLQGRLLIWLVFAVQSTLLHYGTDFTFQFAWMATNPPDGASS